MIILTIHNSYSNICGMNAQQEKQVRAALTYTLDSKANFFSGGFGPRKKCLLDKKGNFPTGLLHRLPPWAITFSDIRIKPVSQPQGFIMKGNPYQWQVSAVKAAEKAGRGIISAPTGTGKSMAMMLLVLRLNVKTLIVVPSLEIKRQLKEAINLPNVTIENIDSKALQAVQGFDCLIIDEAHHVAAKTYQKLNKLMWSGIYYRFFFTATPFRNDTDETLLFESIAGHVIYKLDYQEAIRNRYIVPVEAYYIESPKQKTDAYSYQEVYKDLVVKNTAKNFLIAGMLARLHAAGKSTLCLVREVAHGKALAELTGLPFVHGMDEDSRKYIKGFNSGVHKVLIGTTGILGEGIDTKPCEYVLIAGGGKAKSQFMQAVGRCLRTFSGKDSGKIILIKDASHKYLSRHFAAQKAILKLEYGIIPIRLEVV